MFASNGVHRMDILQVIKIFGGRAIDILQIMNIFGEYIQWIFYK